MTRLMTDNTRRHCSRCGQPLTDAASRECGVGPVCRKKDNHLFAKTIPANYAVAVVHLLALGQGDRLHEDACSTFLRMRKTLLKRAEKAAQANDDTTALKLRGQDLRKIVGDLDFLCSFEHHDYSAKTSIVEIVRALGYVGLAGVLAGEASTSPAKVYFKNGRVYLEGLGNTSGWRTMRKISGITSPRTRGDRTPYSAPAAQIEAFKAAVMRHWPLYEGDFADIEQKCEAFQRSLSAELAEAAQESTVPTFLATIRIRTADFCVSFPWRKDRNMSAFLGELKSIPASGRSYDPPSKAWSFKTEHLDTVKTILAKYYDGVETREALTPTETPVDLYSAKKTWTSRGSRGSRCSQSRQQYTTGGNGRWWLR